MTCDPHVTIPAREEIFGCTSEGVLNGWHREMYDLFDEVQSRIEAYRHAGSSSGEWLHRAAGKVARAKNAIRQIERRLAELGCELPATRQGREAETIRALRTQVRALKTQIEQLSGVAS